MLFVITEEMVLHINVHLCFSLLILGISGPGANFLQARFSFGT